MVNGKSSSEVILVHGLWFRSWAMAHMARKLAEAGFQVRKFNYSTTKQDLGYQAGKLYSFAQGAGGSLPHFVAHSMGGLITLQCKWPGCVDGIPHSGKPGGSPGKSLAYRYVFAGSG
jgi:pimeloyl-ACP methyl ester carboxylesterase